MLKEKYQVSVWQTFSEESFHKVFFSLFGFSSFFLFFEMKEKSFDFCEPAHNIDTRYLAFYFGYSCFIFPEVRSWCSVESRATEGFRVSAVSLFLFATNLLQSKQKK